MSEFFKDFVQTNVGLLRITSIVGWMAVGLGSASLAIWRRHRDPMTWVVPAVLGLLFALEMTFTLRFAAGDLLRTGLRFAGGESAMRWRRPIQAVTVVILFTVAAWLWAKTRNRRHRLQAQGQLAILGVGVGLLGFTLEMISLHYIDEHQIVYWSTWFTGIAVSLTGVSWGLLIDVGALPVTSRGSPEPGVRGRSGTSR